MEQVELTLNTFIIHNIQYLSEDKIVKKFIKKIKMHYFLLVSTSYSINHEEYRQTLT